MKDRLNWDGLKYILALSDGGTMKRAAELLNTDPTTVSRHLRKLTEDTGEILYERDKNNQVTLTTKGEELRQIGLSVRSQLDGLAGGSDNAEYADSVTVTSLEFVLTHYLSHRLDEASALETKPKINLIGSDKRLSLAYGEADIALRFGRPNDGQLVASKIADIGFYIWGPPQKHTKKWVGFPKDLDWTPEMELAREYFGCDPTIRVSSFAAARNAAASLGMHLVGPTAVMANSKGLVRVGDSEGVDREVWSVVHESKRNSPSIAAVRGWAKSALLAGLARHKTKVAANDIKAVS